MTEYEIKLKDLANFVPDFLGFEEVLCSKFEVGLNLNFEERMAVTGNQSFKVVMQLALWAEKLVQGGKRVQENLAKRRGTYMGQYSKKIISKSSFAGASSTSFFRSSLSQSSGQQSLEPFDSVTNTRLAGTKR